MPKSKAELNATSDRLINEYTPLLVSLKVALDGLNRESSGSPSMDLSLRQVQRAAVRIAWHVRAVRRHRRDLIEADRANWKTRPAKEKPHAA